MIKNIFSLDYSEYTHPPVPEKLITYTCSDITFDNYLLGGAEIVLMFRLALKKYLNKDLMTFDRILDFGCGDGRILRFLNGLDADIFGCDVNKPVIDFVNYSFPFVESYCNDFFPPLKYQDNSFQFIYSFSVFSHLSLDAESMWLEELSRVGSPRCIYFFTIHGDWYIEGTLSDSEREVIDTKGFYYKEVHRRFGTDMDFPEGYESSYHSSDYIRKHWSKFFEILEIIRGDDPVRYLPSGYHFEPKGRIPRFRPMGQDLVIARNYK